MKRIILLLNTALILCFSASAQFAWKQASSNGYTYKFVSNDPMNIRYYTLANGLTVILSANKEKPRLQTLIATKAGSKSDPSDHTGLAHYLEHMLFKGTDKYGSNDWANESKYLDMIDNLYEQYNSTKDEAQRKSIYHNIDSVSGIAAKYAIANEYDKMMTSIGAQGTNAFTSFEQTVYVNDIPSNSIDKWLAIEAERFRKPVFRIFHTELEAVYEEKNRGLDNDGDKVFETLFASLFKKHNYGIQTTIGTIEHLKNPSLKAIREYFYNNYVPNNMAVIMVGDINPDEIIAKIDKSFGYMKPKPVAEYKFLPEEEIKSPIFKEVKALKKSL
jgi:predicted Zn-dependent peptidase